MAEFGETLRKARESKGMTQQTLAEKVYVTRQTISRWECGERYPDLLTLKKLSLVLEISTDDLLDNKEIIKVVEKNPIIEKPVVRNIVVVLYALIVFIYAVLAINNVPAYPNLIGSVVLGESMTYMQLFVEISEIIVFVYGFLMTLQGKMNSRRTGYVTVAFFLFEAVRVAGFLAYGVIAVSLLIMIPYIIGAIASFFFYIRKKNELIYKIMILIGAIFGVIRVIYTSYGILIYADHLYSSMNVIGELLTFLIYVLFIYQMTILAIRRKQAAEISGLS